MNLEMLSDTFRFSISRRNGGSKINYLTHTYRAKKVALYDGNRHRLPIIICINYKYGEQYKIDLSQAF